MAYNENPSYPTATVSIAKGGTNATSFTQSNGIVTYNGTSLVNYAGPQLSSGGILTNTTQPAFSAYLTTSITNSTGDGTIYVIVFDTSSLNVGTSFSASTGLFTAPVTGNYMFSYGTYIGTSSTFTEVDTYLHINSSNLYKRIDPLITTTTSDQVFSVIIPLSASDTVGVAISASTAASTKNTTLNGSATNRLNFFSGYLVS